MSTTKTKITMFALGLIMQKSFSSFSYDDISRRFNMTNAAVHYHFKSKEDLGVAICELLRDRIISSRDEDLAAAREDRHPWQYIETKYKAFASGGICPIVSLQADFENLPERLRNALKEVTEAEVENLCLLAHAYDNTVNKDTVVSFLFSLKGALQYRRVMGEKFFQRIVKNIKAQFYLTIPKKV